MRVDIRREGQFLVLVTDDGTTTRINKDHISEISVTRNEFIMIRTLQQLQLFKFNEIATPQEQTAEALATTLAQLLDDQTESINLKETTAVIIERLDQLRETFEKGKIIKLVLTDNQ